ncbi:MAG: hypothetical protein J3Q66DRAFT_407884 [Benniella sp.]|nr:MAG: hypothetical protein J3Q66DRAFT_407884 [Benniella sp.]
MAKNIFSRNVRLPTIPATSLEPETRLSDTRQLEQQDIFDPAAPWVLNTKDEPDEIERLKTLAIDRDDFRYLFKEFYSEIDQSGFLDVAPTRGTCSSTGSDGLDSDDLVKILTLLSTGLKDTLQQSAQHLYQLTVAAWHGRCICQEMNRETVHALLSSYVDALKQSLDPYLVYQAAYAYQARLCVPERVAGAGEIMRVVKTVYEGAVSLGETGQGSPDWLQEGVSFSRKCALYTALRGADSLVRDGSFVDLKAFPEQDTIPKQLRKCEFTEPQIRELKLHHAFILIHGYDEHQQTNNLYASNRLNQLGEWRAKMVISCRSEYLGVDYRDRFQPEDRNA